jgi:hypothetical protein
MLNGIIGSNDRVRFLHIIKDLFEIVFEKFKNIFNT